MKKGDSYQGFWKSAKTENRIHGHEALEIADESRRWGFHEDALPYHPESIARRLGRQWLGRGQGGDLVDDFRCPEHAIVPVALCAH